MRRLPPVLGVVGPIFLAGMLVLLTAVQIDFLRSLGWQTWRNPIKDWPSGLALGPYGAWMNATFIVSGLLVFVFALGLRAQLMPGRSAWLGTNLLLVAGLALMGEVFLADPWITPRPRTWHGILHDIFFVILGSSLTLGIVALGRAFQADRRWRNLAVYSWGTVVLAIPAFFVKGPAFYVFLAAILLWTEVVAFRMRSLQ